MSRGRVRFGYWLFRLVAWDTLLPIAVVLTSEIIWYFFPHNRAPADIAGIVVPITAFLLRFRVGRRHIATNNVSITFRRLQLCVFCLGIFVLVLVDAGIILCGIGDASGLGVLIGVYLCLMAFAMYPGRAWSVRSDNWHSNRMQELIDETRANVQQAEHGNGKVPGMVVWGALVHAESVLFETGVFGRVPSGCAIAIYPEDQSFDNCPQSLQRIARRMFEAAEAMDDTPDAASLEEPSLGSVPKELRSRVPPPYANGQEVTGKEIEVSRRNLPDGYLAHDWFPLFIHELAGSAAIVPCRYWPEQLVRLWRESPLEKDCERPAIPIFQGVAG